MFNKRKKLAKKKHRKMQKKMKLKMRMLRKGAKPVAVPKPAKGAAPEEK